MMASRGASDQIISTGDATVNFLAIVAGRKLSAAARMIEIEADRKKKLVRQSDLANAAHISERTYRTLVASPLRAKDEIVGRLERALARLGSRAPKPDADPELVKAVYRGFLVQMVAHYGVTMAEADSADPQRQAHGTAAGSWYRCAHARQAAIYLTNTALAVRQRRLAELLDLTPAAVCLALKDVEDRRDDLKFEQALKRATWMMTGRDE